MVTLVEVLDIWADFGVFDYVLPFLLIFAVVYGILNYIKVFQENKSVPVLISLVVGILSVRYVEFTSFYTELFPRLGVGVSIILAMLILVGFFFSNKSITAFSWVFLITGVLIFVAVIYNSAQVLGWVDGFGATPSEWIAWVIGVVILIGILVVVVLPEIAPDDSSSQFIPAFGQGAGSGSKK